MKLKEIAEIRTGLVLSRKKATLSDAVRVHYKQITLKSFNMTTSLTRNDLDVFVSTENIPTTYISQVGDVVVRLREPVTAVYIDEKTQGMIIPSLMAIIRVQSSLIDSEFLAYYINASTTQKMLKKEIKGTSIAAIKTKDLEDIEVVLPPLDTQKNIVEVMKLSENEIALLEKLKKEKQQLSQTILDTIIEQNKEEK